MAMPNGLLRPKATVKNLLIVVAFLCALLLIGVANLCVTAAAIDAELESSKAVDDSETARATNNNNNLRKSSDTYQNTCPGAESFVGFDASVLNFFGWFILALVCW